MSLNSRHHQYITQRLSEIDSLSDRSFRDICERDILVHVLAEMTTGQIMSSRPIVWSSAPVDVEQPKIKSKTLQAPRPEAKTPAKRTQISDGLFRVFLITERSTSLTHITSSKFTTEAVLEKIGLSHDGLDVTAITMTCEEAARGLGSTLHKVFGHDRCRRDGLPGFWYPSTIVPLATAIIVYGDDVMGIDALSHRLPDHGARYLDPAIAQTTDWSERIAMVAREYLLLHDLADDERVRVPAIG